MQQELARKKVNIGLDIGIASVGWAILDEDLKIIKHGVRLFETVDDPKDHHLENQIRRQKRSARRLKNRRRNLKLDYIKLLKNHRMIDLEIDIMDRERKYLYDFTAKYIVDKVEDSDFKGLELSAEQKAQLKTSRAMILRKRALTQSLSQNDLIQVLYWYLAHRGKKYTVEDEEQDSEKASKKTKESPFKVLTERYYDSEKLPIENQWNCFLAEGYFRNEFNQNFWRKDYDREVQQILAQSNLDQGFQKEYLELFNRHRSFEIGPGPKKGYENLGLKNYQLISPYSRYYVDEKTGELKSHPNMWARTIGKCTYLPEENRAPKNSLTAEIFNFLNDLNNVSIGHPDDKNQKVHLSPRDKIKCLDIALKTKANTKKIISYLMAEYNVEEQDLKGFRVEGKHGEWKPLVTPLTSFHFVNNVLKKFGRELVLDDLLNGHEFKLEAVDKIVDIFSEFKSVEDRRTKLGKLDSQILDEKIVEELAQAKVARFSENHSLSYKAMQMMLPELLTTNKNQMEIAQENDLFKKKNRIQSGEKLVYLPKKWMDELVASPTVKRSIRQTINLLNAIIKQHKEYQVENVVIEMAREHNGKQAKEAIKNIQKYLAQRNEQIRELVDQIKDRAEKEGWSSRVKGKALLKVWLYVQQHGRDAYDGETLDLDRVVRDFSYTDIDHIIPYSQSFDDSRHNKVLTKKIHNSRKGQLTPFQYLSSEEFARMKAQWAVWYGKEGCFAKTEKRPGGQPSKYELITSELDYSDPNNNHRFIQRNLVDTRYVTREVLAILKEFAGTVEEAHPFYLAKVKTINGKATSYLRKIVDTKKNPLRRPDWADKDGSLDENGIKIRQWNGHHAEDAVLVTHLALRNPGLGKLIEKIVSNPGQRIQDVLDKVDKGSNQKMSKIFDEHSRIMKPNEIREDLNANMEKVRFSYMVNKKRNTQLFNETLYGSKKLNGKIHKVVKINIANSTTKVDDLKKIFSDDYKYVVPMKIHDPKTFLALKTIFLNGGEKNPFSKLADAQGRVPVIFENKKGEQVTRRVSAIKVVKEEKELDDVVLRKGKSGSTNSFYESMKWTAIHLYRDNKGKYQLIPINALVAKYYADGSYKLNDEYRKKLKEKGINNDIGFLVVYKGDIIVDKDENAYRVCGCVASSNKLELKRLDGKPVLDSKGKETRDIWTLNTKLAGCKLVELDYLGRTKRVKHVLRPLEVLIEKN